tara:strand:+ start:5579 stop:5761 length:183 start_codon:yes stop_codon:yes gene_type:complete
MSARSVTAAEIRAAKKFLNSKKIATKELSPRKFASLAKAVDKGFKETLRIIAGEQTGGVV